MGSSPRMRGTLAWHASAAMATGIIPAYAGNTYRRGSTGSPSGDHPRVCGEHPIVLLVRADPEGSSPRMRGTRLISGV